MSRDQLILIGAGGHAISCIDVIEQTGQFQVVGLIGLPNELNTKCLDYPVIATDDGLSDLRASYSYTLITAGQIAEPDTRIRLYRIACDLGFELPSIVAPSAYVSEHACLGNGTIVMHGAIVNAGVSIGNNCIVNSRTLIEHGAYVNDHCHISTGAILNGGVVIGAGSFVGSGSQIKEGIKLGERCIVAMGLSVRHHLSDQTKFLSDRR